MRVIQTAGFMAALTEPCPSLAVRHTHPEPRPPRPPSQAAHVETPASDLHCDTPLARRRRRIPAIVPPARTCLTAQLGHPVPSPVMRITLPFHLIWLHLTSLHCTHCRWLATSHLAVGCLSLRQPVLHWFLPPEQSVRARVSPTYIPAIHSKGA